MFYLSIIGKIGKSYPVRSGIFVLLSIMWLLFPVLEGPTIEWIKEKIPVNQQGASFHALVSADVNLARISRQLRIFPGVLQVAALDREQLQQRVKKILVNMPISGELLQDSLGIDMRGLKVVFNRQSGQRSYELVRNYLKKLVGEKNIVLGPIIIPKKGTRWIEHWFTVIQQWGGVIVSGIITILWWMTFAWWRRVYIREVRLLQRFQRRSNIALKSYVLLAALLFVVTAPVYLWNRIDLTFVTLGMILLSLLISVLSFIPRRELV